MRRIHLYGALFLGLLLSAAVHAQYAARITVSGGNTFVAKELNIKNGRLYTDTGRAASSVSMVKEVEFRFPGLDLNMCENMFRSFSSRKSLEGLLEQYVGPVKQYTYLPGNLGEYLVWMLRVQFWNGSYTEANQTIELLRDIENTTQQKIADLYYCLILIEQDRVEDAKTVFARISDPDQYSQPMAEYIRGRIALEEGAYRQAMMHAAEIIAFYSRDVEWMPPATALEALIYQRTGQLQKAGIVADELMMAYPGSQWSRLGEKIKQEAM